MHDKEKDDLAITKSTGILSNLVADQYQHIIKGKTPKAGLESVTRVIPIHKSSEYLLPYTRSQLKEVI